MPETVERSVGADMVQEVGTPASVQESAGMRCLLVFRHRLLEFRIAELRSLAEMNGLVFVQSSDMDVRVTPCVHLVREAPPDVDPSRVVVLEGPLGGEPMSPIWYARVPSAEAARALVDRSVLTKAVIELWGEGETWEGTAEGLREACGEERAEGFMREDETFKFHIDTFGVSIHGREHPGMMAKVGWLARRWRGSVNLTRPDHVMWILHCTTEDGALPRSIPTRWFFGRQLATAGDCIWLPYVLTKRPYIGTTSMDAQVAFVMANMAQARRSSVAMDPFAGTGSILVALAHFGAHTIGMDYDIRAIRDGKEDKRGATHTIYSNYKHYGITHPAGLLCDDFSRWALRGGLEGIVDAIVCDPPYGVRESGKRVRASEGRLTEEQRKDRMPSSQTYLLGECMADLLNRAAEVLRIGGRLVFFMPWFEEGAEGDMPTELEVLSTHPCLRLVAFSEQPLLCRYSRRLVTMEKTSPYDEETCKAHSARLRGAKLTVDAIRDFVFKKSEDLPEGFSKKARKKRFRSKLT